jgi:hypothetical protein
MVALTDSFVRILSLRHLTSNFKGFRRVRKIVKSDCLSVYLSVRMEQLGSYWPNFHEILYLRGFSEICRENSYFIKFWEE